jgi:hypothetical protein
MVYSALAEEKVSTDLKFDFIIHAVSQFTAEEIESIHGMDQFSGEIFDDLLQAKGLPRIPHSSQELKTIVENQKAAQKPTTAEEKAQHPHVRPAQKD